MSDDDSSGLSSLGSDIEDPTIVDKKGILKFFSKVSKNKNNVVKNGPPASPSPPPRELSPPHEYVLADNPDIAFAVMFRSRFTIAFPKSVPHFGPQELERSIVPAVPGDTAVQFLCGLLGLLLNRKQDVKSDHYNRALEEAISTHKQQWARDWQERNPIAGKASFETMTPVERLTLLKTLILWTLASSQVVKDIITASYKQNRHEDDLNQPLSIQPWGQDSYKKKYYLVEGIDDTNFRVYKESNGFKERTWWSVAGNIDELVMLADKLSTVDGGQKARVLALKMRNAIPRFEATEEKRKRREYRQTRKEQFKRPDPGFGIYEGRTRGKRMRYTFSDGDEEPSSDTGSRRSVRNTGTNTPSENGPTITQSGRQVRTRHGGAYGESVISNGQDAEHSSENVSGRTDRSRRTANSSRIVDNYVSDDDMNDYTDPGTPDLGDDEDDDHVPVESDDYDELDGIDGMDELNEDDPMDIEESANKTLVVRLPVRKLVPEVKDLDSVRTDEPPGLERDKTTRDVEQQAGIGMTSKQHDNTIANDQPQISATSFG